MKLPLWGSQNQARYFLKVRTLWNWWGSNMGIPIYMLFFSFSSHQTAQLQTCTERIYLKENLSSSWIARRGQSCNSMTINELVLYQIRRFDGSRGALGLYPAKHDADERPSRLELPQAALRKLGHVAARDRAALGYRLCWATENTHADTAIRRQPHNNCTHPCTQTIDDTTTRRYTKYTTQLQYILCYKEYIITRFISIPHVIRHVANVI